MSSSETFCGTLTVAVESIVGVVQIIPQHTQIMRACIQTTSVGDGGRRVTLVW